MVGNVSAVKPANQLIYAAFARIIICSNRQSVDAVRDVLHVKINPNLRFRPKCHTLQRLWDWIWNWALPIWPIFDPRLNISYRQIIVAFQFPISRLHIFVKKWPELEASYVSYHCIAYLWSHRQRCTQGLGSGSKVRHFVISVPYIRITTKKKMTTKKTTAKIMTMKKTTTKTMTMKKTT